MHINNANGTLSHLSYCSNIHPGETWAQVNANLQRFLPGIRQAMQPQGQFGVGLRLSAQAVADLAEPDALDAFKQFLDENQLYVFTINGFPYGPFHGTRVKEDVYLPDWMDNERLRYTNQLADVFAGFLPTGHTGSISTVPGAFKARVTNNNDRQAITDNMVAHVAHLVALERQSGQSIVLAIEPEPCCFLETIDECVDFFTEYLFGAQAQQALAKLTDTTPEEALLHLQKHLTLCLDLCHAAVEFEDYDECVAKLKKAGITVGKLQISAGLRLPTVTASTRQLLTPFDDDVYLHQVVEHRNGAVNRFTDLTDAFATLGESDEPAEGEQREWRVHFHVPIFLKDMGDFSSTQFFVEQALNRHKTDPISEHLEVETYTWNVLPEQYRSQAIEDAIVRELTWVTDKLS